MKLSSGAIETARTPASLTSIIKTAATALALPFSTAAGTKKSAEAAYDTVWHNAMPTRFA